MALTTLCEQCEHDWIVDQLVFVEAVNKNLCPVCINQLVDVLVGGCTESEWLERRNHWEAIS